MNEATTPSENEVLWTLSKDLKGAVTTLDREQARFLVDAYYSMQKDRMGAAGQVRACEKSKEPHGVLDWVKDRAGFVEKQIAVALKYYAEGQYMGQWAMNVRGIGPVIAAGLLAHIDVEPWKCAHATAKRKLCRPDAPCGPECCRIKIATAGQVWSFAGLNPSAKWDKGSKRPWNAALKNLCWKIGESFMKVSGHPDAFYGKLYLERKAREQQNNEAGAYLEQAQAGAGRVKKTTEAYKYYAAGKLPPGHIHARAKRYAVKLFLSHYHHELYKHHFGVEPPKPYPIAILGHAHEIAAK